MKSPMSVVRGALGMIVGYIVMGALITLVQETWFGGVSWTLSSSAVLMAAGFLSFLAAIAGGWAAAWIVGPGPIFQGVAMCLLVAAETTWLITTGRTHDPFWFDVSAAGSLVAGILTGTWLRWARLPDSMKRSIFLKSPTEG